MGQTNVNVKWNFLQQYRGARTLAELDTAMNRGKEPTCARGRAFKEQEERRPPSRRSRSPRRKEEADVALQPLNFTVFVGNSFFVLDLGLDIVYGAKGFRLKGDYLVGVNRGLERGQIKDKKGIRHENSNTQRPQSYVGPIS